MRFLRFLPIALLAGVLSLHGAASASAATVTPLTEQALKSAPADGQTILLDISATWCPTCARMQSTLTVFHGATLKGGLGRQHRSSLGQDVGDGAGGGSPSVADRSHNPLLAAQRGGSLP